MKRKLKKILIILMCIVIIINNCICLSGRNNKFYAAAFVIPAGTVVWNVVGSLFVTAMGYCLYDSVNTTAKEKLEATYDISSGLTKEEAYDALVAEGPSWYAEEESVLSLLTNMYKSGAFLTVPALNAFVGAYINRTDEDNPVSILEEYFGSTLVNGENSSYMTSLGDSKLMSYSTTAGTNGLFLTNEALMQLINDLSIAINTYTDLSVIEYADTSIVTDANALCGDNTSLTKYNNSYLNRETYKPSLPAVPDITTAVNTNQEYIIFHCNYSVNQESIWTWCLTWAEPEGYDAAQYLRADSVYTLDGRNLGQQAPCFFFDTCAVDEFPHYSNVHTEQLISDGLNFNMYGLKNGEWVLHSDFTASVNAQEWYKKSYMRFDYGYICYNSVPIPAMLKTGTDTYEFIEEFYKVYTIDGMRSNADILSPTVDDIVAPLGITADYVLVDTNTGVNTMTAINSNIRENVITGVVDDDIATTLTGVIDTTNDDAVGVVADTSTGVITNTIQSVVTPTLPDGNFQNFIMDEGLASKFPFCIPFDLINTVRLLASDPVCPRWEIPFTFARLGINEVIVIDLAPFETVAAICRWCETIVFIIFLIMVTRKLISG